MALDDVSKISPYVLNNNVNFGQKDQGDEKVKQQTNQSVKPQTEQKSPQNILDALTLTGAQNKAFLGLNNIDPTKYLSPERIQDIENSMKTFEKGVQDNLDAINQEFGGIAGEISESYKLQLAAQMMV